MSDWKPILCVDFDGTIHSYDRGWQNGLIYGQAVAGFFKWAIEAQKVFRLVVYSSRSKTPEMRDAMAEAIKDWAADALRFGQIPADTDVSQLLSAFEYAAEKPPAFVTIDDRAITFRGDWTAPHLDPADLLAFRPWNAPG